MARERWWADGYELTDGFLRDVEVRDGLMTPAGGNSNVQDVSAIGRHGVLDGIRRTYGAGSFVVQMWLLDTRFTDAEWQTLLRAVMPQHRLVHWERMLPDGTMRETWGRCPQAPTPTSLGRQGVRVSLEIAVPRAFWQDEVITTDATAAGAALPQVLPLASKAGASAPMADLQFTITGPVTNPLITCTSDPTVNDQLGFVGVVPAGASLTVDAGTWTVTAVGMPVPTLDAFTWTGYRLLEVPPAIPGQVPTVQLDGSGGGAGTKLSVAGRAKYLAAS